MAAKDKSEMKAFIKAKADREILLDQIERSESSVALAKLQIKAKDLAPSRVNLKLSHSVIISGLNQKIAQAFLEKEELLAKKEKEAQVKASLKKLVDNVVTVKNKTPSKSPNVLEAPLTDANKEKRLAAVRAQLDTMREKASVFLIQYNKTKAERYLNAYNAAQNIIEQVEGLTNQYASNKIKLPAFKAQAKELLAEKNTDVKELQKHRGWKEIVVNLLAAVVGGLFYLAAAAYTGSLTLFRPETNATKKVKALANAISNVEVDENEPDLIIESSGLGCHK